jgi:hypothetical protein
MAAMPDGLSTFPPSIRRGLMNFVWLEDRHRTPVFQLGFEDVAKCGALAHAIKLDGAHPSVGEVKF